LERTHRFMCRSFRFDTNDCTLDPRFAGRRVEVAIDDATNALCSTPSTCRIA
jgi:hypothetical protein